jgi:hypothetical protein
MGTVLMLLLLFRKVEIGSMRTVPMLPHDSRNCREMSTSIRFMPFINSMMTVIMLHMSLVD